MSDRIARLATDFTELLNAFYQAPRYHVACELLLMLWVVWLIFVRKPKQIERQLTEEEKEDLIADWRPEPLVPPSDPNDEDPLWLKRRIEGPVTHIVKVDGNPCINFATFNFLDLVGSKRIADVACAAVEKYGVGACGPRGFYGTIDIHLDVETYISQLLEVDETVLYSYGFSTLASVIPAYAKRGDVIFADQCINYALQKGVQASRSDVHYFAHNDERPHVVDHQRLSSLGYCFSAALPPLLAAAALEGMRWMDTEEGQSNLKHLRELSHYLHRNLIDIPDLDVTGESFSPLKHIRLNNTRWRKNEKILQNWTNFHVSVLDKLVVFAQRHDILLTRCARLEDDIGSDIHGTIRITLSVACTEEEINKLCLIIRRGLIETIEESTLLSIDKIDRIKTD